MSSSQRSPQTALMRPYLCQSLRRVDQLQKFRWLCHCYPGTRGACRSRPRSHASYVDQDATGRTSTIHDILDDVEWTLHQLQGRSSVEVLAGQASLAMCRLSSGNGFSEEILQATWQQRQPTAGICVANRRPHSPSHSGWSEALPSVEKIGTTGPAGCSSSTSFFG